ncbi:MAG: NADH-quinone oxidoreductase subunit [Actinomycetota bacterium]|nr:NADH-quinone oxidoreductase subunit [Actinomycetota bacterium]
MTALLAQATGINAPIRFPNVEYSVLVPEITLVVGALVILMVASLSRRRHGSGLYAGLTIVTGVVALGSAANLWNRVSAHGPSLAVAKAVAVDGFSMFFLVLISITVVLGALLAESYVRREDLPAPEFFVLLLLSASGGMLMASANDLIVLFLGLEILSIALYVLAGYHARREASREAAMKYFVLGAFSSAIFLYGIALTYGATGTTNLGEIAVFLSNNVLSHNGVLLAGMGLMLVGLGFKVAAVPFHTWTPDVYQGSPSPVTGFMAAAAKAAGFAGLLRVFFSGLSSLQLDWRPVVFVMAVLTLAVGSVLALVQTDVKRMLAYSSISHAGYVLVGLQAASKKGIAGSLFYLLAYTFMVLGSFAVVTLVGRRGDAHHSLDDYRGLAARRPGLALVFTVFLMAQAGVPFTSGFLAKFYVIAAAVDRHSYALAIVAMLGAAVAAFFYLRIVILMYGPAAEGEEPAAIAIPRTAGAALAICLAFTVVVGLLPSPVIDFARHATLLF